VFKKDTSKPFELCVTDLRRYIGICIFMSIIHLPSSRDYWSDVLGNQHITEAMSVICLRVSERIYIFFYNVKIIECGKDGHDRLYRSDQYMNFCVLDFLLYMEDCLSVDEQMYPMSFVGHVYSGKANPKETLKLSKFQSEIAKCLFMSGTSPRGGRRSSDLENKLQAKKRKGPTVSVPPKDVRQDQVGHWPVWLNRRQRCKMPGCKGYTWVEYPKFKLGL
jgi:hypothetical protein